MSKAKLKEDLGLEDIFSDPVEREEQKPAPSVESEFISKTNLMRLAGFPILYVVAPEDTRCIETMARSVREADPKLAVARWDILKGWKGVGPADGSGNGDPVGAISALWPAPPGVYLMQGIHHFLKDFGTIQIVKDAIPMLKNSDKQVVFVCPLLQIPPELEKDLTVVRFKLPGRAELRKVLETLVTGFRSLKPIEPDKLDIYNETLRNITPGSIAEGAEAGLGLTELEFENAAALSITDKRCIDPVLIRNEKAAAVRKTDILEIMEVREDMANVGGLNDLKIWLEQRRQAYEAEALEYGLEIPKGILLAGPPGSGKSLVAKCIASSWKVPLIRLDMSRIYQSLVGQSENRARTAIDLVEAIGHCVLMIDEVDQGMSGANSGGKLDSGVSSRVIGTFLTWMQEKTSPVFVVMTANGIDSLPPQLTRKGRLDEIFHVDLPTASELQEIYAIHLTKRKRDPKKLKLDLFALAQRSAEFSGAEAEAVVKDAMFTAYNDGGREITQADLLAVVNGTIPLARSRKEEIDRMRAWAERCAKPASGRTNGNAAGKARIKL